MGGQLIRENNLQNPEGGEEAINNALHVLMYRNYVCEADFGLFNLSFPVNSNVFLLPVTRPLRFLAAVSGCEGGRRPGTLQGHDPPPLTRSHRWAS